MPCIIIYQCADIQQLQFEAQHRWLRPAEILEILSNFKLFQITPEPPNKPPSMISDYFMLCLVYLFI